MAPGWGSTHLGAPLIENDLHVKDLPELLQAERAEGECLQSPPRGLLLGAPRWPAGLSLSTAPCPPMVALFQDLGGVTLQLINLPPL